MFRGGLGAAVAANILLSGFALHASEAEIRVRLQRRRQSIELTGTDLRVSPPSAFLESDPFEGFHRLKITRLKSGAWSLKWDHLRKSLQISSDRLWVRGQMIRLGVEPAPYDLEILENNLRGLDVIARLDVETYLQGVLPAEMPVSWPLEALKAQAVSARSFVLRQALERRSKDFDVDSTVLDQMYKFTSEVAMHPEWIAKVHQAIDETRGQVLVDSSQRVLKAFYSADCGCQSEDPKFVWGKLESLQSVKDPTCLSRHPTFWSFNLERQEVREKLIAALGLPENSSIKALNIGGRTPSGRVAKVVASVDAGGKTKVITLNSQEFRRIFGFHKIQSTDFTLHWQGEQLEVAGKGSGHGVGLCQRGARSMAKGGAGYREILKAYYPRVSLLSPAKEPLSSTSSL